jgi:hypothetical protein
MSRTRILANGLALGLLMSGSALAQGPSYRFTAREASNGQIDLTLQRNGNNRNTRGWSREALQGLAAAPFAAGAPVHFRIAQDAGTLSCDGSGSGGRAEGECRFERIAAYFDGLRQRGVTVSRDWDALQLAWFEVKLALLDELKRQGYETPEVDELIGAGVFRVNVDWLRELDAAGYRERELRDLIPFRIFKVDAAFIRDIKAANPKLRPSAKQLVQFRIHKLEPAWIAGWTQLGYELNPDQLVTSRIHNVSPDYARAMMGEVRDRPSFDQFVAMRIHGVRPSGNAGR